MEELATEMAFLERSSSTKLRTGISFGFVILTIEICSEQRIFQSNSVNHASNDLEA
jgi:hypothetical protein